MSNVFLESRNRLSELQELALVDLGWDAPCPNYQMAWESPVPVHVVAGRMVKTLANIYGATDGGCLSVITGIRQRREHEPTLEVRSIWPADLKPASFLGMPGPEQDAFLIVGSGQRDAQILAALVPDELQEQARHEWTDRPAAIVARDLSWAWPCSQVPHLPSDDDPSPLRDLASGAVPIDELSDLVALKDRADDRRIRLRAEIRGHDRRYLTAHLDDQGDLHIDGQDLGPGTAPMSNDGEYEYCHTYLAADLPSLVKELGGQPGEHILDLLQRKWSGPQSDELERLLQESTIPASFWNWSG